MVDLLSVSSSIRATFRYNEKKVEAGVAMLLSASNYPMDMERMGKEHRLNMLLKLAERRKSVKVNSVHITLNFAPGEALPQDKLKLIADDYMQAIGFGNQPYLVYQHFDAGHPHLHVVSVKVDAQGKRMETHFRDKNALNRIRQGLESKYNLVRAEDHQKDLFELKPVPAAKAEYGKAETRSAIYNILINVLPRYNYTSLGELNAILKGYNITADPGTEGSRTRAHKGLLYRILGPDGTAIGVPVPASKVYDKATLKKLEERFLKNKIARVGLRPRVKHLVDLCFRKFPKATFQDLQDELAKASIRLVCHGNETGQIFGLSYVDYKDKIAWNGTALGKAYAANGITKRCFAPAEQPGRQMPLPVDKTEKTLSLFERLCDLNLIDTAQVWLGEPSPDYTSSSGERLFEILSRGELLAHWLPYELRRKKKRRRKRKPNT